MDETEEAITPIQKTKTVVIKKNSSGTPNYQEKLFDTKELYTNNTNRDDQNSFEQESITITLQDKNDPESDGSLKTDSESMSAK